MDLFTVEQGVVVLEVMMGLGSGTEEWMADSVLLKLVNSVKDS